MRFSKKKNKVLFRTPHINQIFLWREKSNEIIPLLISLGIPGSSGILKASLLTCSIISFKCVCPLNDHASLSKQKKWICHLLPTLVSLQPRADNPLGTKNSHLTLPPGFVTRAFGWVRPQGTKKTKIESKKKKKLALKERRSPNNYKLTLVPTVYCWSTQIGIPLSPEPSPFPWGSGSWGKPSPRQYLYGDGEGSGNYECPREIPTPCEGSSAKNRKSWRPLSWHWGRTICQTRQQTPGFRSPHLALPSGKLIIDKARLVLRGGVSF